jgi:murein DD-endopeptidase MepM/ murein hydrolase activator NlpD
MWPQPPQQHHRTGTGWVLILAILAVYVASRTAPVQALHGPPAGAVCPVHAKLNVLSEFGACRDGCARRHKGIDLGGPEGTPVQAVTSGRIIRAHMRDGEALGGITLTLRGADGTTYFYAHHRRNLVSKGAKVAKGQRIALVGHTGNARTTPPHLHFEIHPGGGAAIDPAAKIRRWCR